MHLIYLDESGNSGTKLTDAQQPVFVLCALVVHESNWRAFDEELAAVVNDQFPSGSADDFEVHGADLRNGSGFFKGISVAQRIAFRDRWLSVGSRHGAAVIYRAIEKRLFAAWLRTTFGPGVLINPHVAAFLLVARVVNDYLRKQPGPSLGLFISDDNREITVDVEKALRLLRVAEGTINLGQFVEKGFFIDSAKSRLIQWCAVVL